MWEYSRLRIPRISSWNPTAAAAATTPMRTASSSKKASSRKPRRERALLKRSRSRTIAAVTACHMGRNDRGCATTPQESAGEGAAKYRLVWAETQKIQIGAGNIGNIQPCGDRDLFF